MGQKMTIRKGEISLDQWGDRKSFYGKAAVREEEGVKILRSYGIDYAAQYDGVIVRLSDYYSVTSKRHMQAFFAYSRIAYNGIGERGFYNLPYVRTGWNDIERIKAKCREISNQTANVA